MPEADEGDGREPADPEGRTPEVQEQGRDGDVVAGGPGEWPVEDCMPRASSGNAMVDSAPTGPRTSSATAAVSAATMTIPR